MPSIAITPNDLLKYSILALIMLNIPGIVMKEFSSVLSSMLSYLSFGLLLIFYLLNKRTGINGWLILIGLSYFTLSSLSGQSYMPLFIDFVIFCIKYFIIIICGYEVMKRTSDTELSIFLTIGALSILLQIFFFHNPLTDYGRYSGFYINPNAGGFICILGYSLSYSIKNEKLKGIAQMIFIAMGILTFSRTFIILWILINLIAIRVSIKNAYKLGIGLLLLLGLLTYNEFLPVKNPRISQISGFISGDSRAAQDLNEGSRLETWEHFYGYLIDNPIFGNGFGAFGGGGVGGFIGVHNSYLKVWGEAGIIPFLLFLLFFGVLIKKSASIFLTHPHFLFMSISLMAILATNHNFFELGYLLFTALWIHVSLLKSEEENSSLQNNIKANDETL
ncbi:O-antigen ligase family protein [Zobellia uliginosa]|uniref:O-antigen ligase family protein n=1 Tax=Zobellia uliginosa TaxID=143224 RepID=UPI0026E46DE8|nr:O-antigen ligase family protein [Zobellia uliginosa]MDO6518278.1 hypothetical protein [Zobellia uliginosa]